MSFTESKTDSTVRYAVSEPYVYGVGMRTTEGQKVLNALHKLQQKLNSRANNAEKRPVIKLKSNISMNASGDHVCNMSNIKLNKSTNTTVIDSNKVNISAKLIEKRLDMIEKQLQNLSHLVTTQPQKNVNNPYPTPSPSVASVSSKDEQTVVTANIHKYVDNSAQTTNENIIKAKMIHIKPITKSKSTEFIDKTVQTKHFHITSKDIPFILGTSSKSHSAIAKKQLILSKLKQHNKLCYQKPTPKIIEHSVGNDAIDHEIKELLYDLQEEHNYICDEIQHLTKQLENITDTQKKSEFQRELYFLSRRIIAKKKQINELQQLHALIMKNAPKNKTSFEPSSDNFIRRKENRKSLSAERLTKFT